MAEFSHPTLVWGPRSGGNPHSFVMKFDLRKLESSGYRMVKQSFTDSWRTDGRTGRETHRHVVVANTRASIAYVARVKIGHYCWTSYFDDDFYAAMTLCRSDDKCTFLNRSSVRCASWKCCCRHRPFLQVCCQCQVIFRFDRRCRICRQNFWYL